MNELTNTLIDNSEQFRLADILKIAINNEHCTELCIASGYWDLPGMNLIFPELKQFFDRGGKMRLLIGKEPSVRDYQLAENKGDAEEFPDFFIKRDFDRLTDEYKPAVELILEQMKEEDTAANSLQIRIYGQKTQPPQFLHAKCYIMLGAGYAKGIIGSSNFTKKGLLDNAELNYLESENSVITSPLTSYSSSKSHLVWFNEKWEQSVDWSGKFIHTILKPSKIGKAAARELEKKQRFTPYEAYIGVLDSEFGSIIDETNRDRLKNYLPSEIKPLDFQLEAVGWCSAIMQRHGGFILGDVVGLGKTITAVLIAKSFIERSGSKVLIITPPAIKQGWIDTIELFDRNREDKMLPNVDFITNGSVDKILGKGNEDVELDADSDSFDTELKQENYGMILIDESHKFRNNDTQMYASLNDLISKIGYETGKIPYIGLISATPQNNSPEDLKNQIYLFERTPKKSTFDKIENNDLEHFFAETGKKYRELIHAKLHSPEEEQNNRKQLLNLSDEIRDKVLSDILVRRTRADIEKYSGFKFPEVIGPNVLNYKMDKELSQKFFNTMAIIAPDIGDELQVNSNDIKYLRYYRYRATEFLKEEFQNPYSEKNMTPKKSSAQLAKIMQILLVKRLESSFAAFKKSLRNFQKYTQNMISMWEKNSIFICPDLNINAELDLDEKILTNPNADIDSCFDDIRNKINQLTNQGKNPKNRNAEFTRENFDQNYIELLRDDKTIVDDLVNQWNSEDYDPKLDEFKDSLRHTLFDKEKNRPQKLVIFSEALDTVEAINRAVEASGHTPLVVSAKNRKELSPIIAQNFDANFAGEKRNDYDVIITTEVLAEGINLHRANTILNYDTPWNATRLIQRIGRVNRIGSNEEKIYVYNFYPSAEGDLEINLLQNTMTKLQAFHVLFGEDSQIFSTEEKLFTANFSHIIDDEESPMAKYIAELKLYKSQHLKRLGEIEKSKSILSGGDSVSGENLFALKTSAENSGCIYAKVSAAGAAKIIPLPEMLALCSCAPDTPAGEIPDDAEALAAKAFAAFNLHFNRVFNPARKKSKAEEDAFRFIDECIESKKYALQTVTLLDKAGRMIKQGNNYIVKIVNRLKNRIENAAFADECEDLIVNELENLDKISTGKDGKPYVKIAIYTINK